MDSHSIIIPGCLNTEITALDVDRLDRTGGSSLGGRLKIGPSGKAVHMAQMAAAYLGPGRVAVIGKSSRDPLGFWKIPIDALTSAGVETAYIKIPDFAEASFTYPGVTLRLVDHKGRHRTIVLPGINADFCTRDVDAAADLFHSDTLLVTSLDIPEETALHAMTIAASRGMRIVLDLSGLDRTLAHTRSMGVFLLKCDARGIEARTGNAVSGPASAEKAARLLLAEGFQNILITLEPGNGYFVNDDVSLRMTCPRETGTEAVDERGCDDQVTAVVASCLSEGMGLVEAVRWGIFAGKLQSCRTGIQPVSRGDLIGQADLFD